MINQDLGIATAYGYAKSKGYTGSEDDFATLMANYASVGTSAAASALKSEGFAVGEQNGTPVTSGSPYYQNNAKYYVEQIDGALALAYSSSATYEVGDYVMHSGGLYRCISAISTAEAWTAAHWTQVAMGDEVADLKTDFSDYKNYGEDVIDFDVIANSYVTRQGEITAYNGWSRTDYIEVEEGRMLYIVGNSAYSQYNCWYDENKAFISAFNLANSELQTVDVPSNAKYVIFSSSASGLLKGLYYRQNFYAESTELEYTNNELDATNKYLLEGVYQIQKTDLKQGYFSEGTGFLDKASDSPKYLVFMMPIKFKKGTSINVNSVNWYCSIDVYGDANWDASSQRLTYGSFQQNYIFTMPCDGYPLIAFASASKYADRTAISVDNYAEDVKVIPNYGRINNYAYTGVKINTKKHGFSVIQRPWNFTQPSSESAESGQGATQWGDTIFKCWNANVIQSYDATTGDVIDEFEVESGHGNNISFSNEYYDVSDDFPLAYVTPEETSGQYQLFRVFRLTTTSATLVKTIAVPTTECGYYANAIIDAERNIMYLNGYTYHSYSNGTVDGHPNLMRITSWDLNDLTASGDYYVPTFIKEFNVPFISTHQGEAFFDDKIFVIKSEISNTQTIVYVIDPYKEKIVSTFANFPTNIKDNECEGIWFVENDFDYSMFICRLLQVYEIIFD